MKYNNPIIHADFSDPDAIRVKDDFYLIASSFNHLPALPILHSKNLVEWSYVGYALDKLDTKFDSVRHGEGVWAPSIRYNNGIFYIVFPMPDEGIFEIHSKSITGPWSKPNCLISGKGYEDPCPIWVDDKAYMVFSFVKSRIGFNSLLAVIEIKPDLSETVGEYKIVYDGHNDNPTIEGPKFYKRNDYFYILAPAGSVKGGWQTALRSKNIFGPYESKIILYQSDTLINGPHQGALIDLDDEGEKFAFIHFQDKRAYGRICHLEPVTWVNDWPLCGSISDPLLAGAPVSEGEYPVNIKTGEEIQISDDFKGDKLGFMWQHPSNIDNFYSINNGLKFDLLETLHTREINLIPYTLLTKVSALEFDIETNFDLSLLSENEHFGFIIYGINYKALDFTKSNDQICLSIIDGEFGSLDKIEKTIFLDTNEICIKGLFRNRNIYDLIYSITLNEKPVIDASLAYAAKWIGSKLGFYGYGRGGSVLIKNYLTNVKK